MESRLRRHNSQENNGNSLGTKDDKHLDQSQSRWNKRYEGCLWYWDETGWLEFFVKDLRCKAFVWCWW